MTTTVDRVARHTDQAVNWRIERETGARIRRCAGDPRQIERRLRELDREWDIERILETNASAIALLGMALAAHDRRWLLLPGLVAAFLLQHAVQGWCPPIPVLRRLGVRTSREIETERTALKMLRGDFDGLDRGAGPYGRSVRADRAVRAARR
jgi:hypothetical protein